ncbi:fucolectin-4-like isoform X3 [Osmerus mordax]|uniref:fucolectin-4-like isoform X3 n=1 Tax=Osmerus mordax TaxID=8014 RepID=UPI003510ACA0
MKNVIHCLPSSMLKLLILVFWLNLLGLSIGATARKNLALYGKATQSTLGENPWAPYGHASNAIDGNHNTWYEAGSCTYTGKKTNPWWRVDLLDTYIVTSVTITNRNVFPERLNGAEIRIGNSINNDGTDNPLANVINSIPAGKAQTINLKKGENLALQGKASQSSLLSTGIAYNAIDGNRASNWAQASCSHTAANLNPWWRLDLRKTYKVFSVVITNYETPTRLNGAEIRIGNSLYKNGNKNPRCAVISSIPGGFTQTFHCNGMEGRYVNVVIPGRKEYLILCEVEVYGSPLN